MQVATLLVWNEGTDPERIKKWIEKLKELGVIQDHYQSNFDPKYSVPVLYFP